MRKNILLPAVALLGGMGGFALRKWQLSTGFDPATGLAIPGAPAAIVLILWSCLVAAALLALCWNNREQLTWDRAFQARGNTLFLTAAVLSAFLLLISAGAEIVNFSVMAQTAPASSQGGQAANILLPRLRILFYLGGFPAVLLWAKNLYRGDSKGKESLPLLELCLLLCLWLISAYQLRAVDPVVQDYLYEILAIVAGLLGVYSIAGYSFQTGRPRQTVVCSLMAVYFSLVTLADAHTMAELLRYGFLILFLTAHAVLLLQDHPAGEAPVETECDENG